VTKEDAGNYTCAPSNAQADSVLVHVIEGKILFCFWEIGALKISQIMIHQINFLPKI